MPRVLVTGGAGFIGSAVIRHILDGQSLEELLSGTQKMRMSWCVIRNPLSAERRGLRE